MGKIAIFFIIVFFSSCTPTYRAYMLGNIPPQGIRSGMQNQPNERGTNTFYPASGRQHGDIDMGVRLYNEGKELREKEQYREAIVKLNMALDIAIRNNISFGAMNCLILLGLSHDKLNETEVAIKYYKEALRISKEVNDTAREKSSLKMLAISYNKLGDLSTSIWYEEEYLALANRIGDINDQIEALSSLSRSSKDRIKSLSYNEQALQLSRQIGDKINEIEQLLIISKKLLIFGKTQKALDYINQALSLAKEIKNKAMIADCTFELGSVHLNLGDYTKAIRLLEDAYKMHENERNDFGQTLDSMFMGFLYMSTENYYKAIDYFERCKRIASRIKFQSVGKMIYTNVDPWLAICYLLTGEKEVAYQLIKNAESRLLISLFDLLDGNPKKAVSGIPKEELLGYPKKLFAGLPKESIVGLYTIFGLAYEKIGDFRVAEYCFKMAIAVTEKLRIDLHADNRNQFLGGKPFPPYDRITAYEGLSRISTPENALACSEAIKARSFLEILARKQDIAFLEIPDNIKSQEERFAYQLSELRNKQESAFGNNNKIDIANSEQELNVVKQKEALFLEKLYDEYPQYASIKYPKPLDISKLKINKNELILEYLITKNRTFGWLIKDNRIVKSISIDIAQKEIENLIDLYRSQIEKESERKDKKFDSKLGYKLYQLLIKDFEPFISPSYRLIIIPDKQLWLLPFESIVTKPLDIEAPTNTKNYAISPGVKFLGDEYNISYYQSASTMTRIRNLKKRDKYDKNIFILADPVFESTDERLKSGSRFSVDRTVSTQMKEVQDFSGIRFPRLTATEWLSNNLAKQFEDKEVVRITNIEANETNVKSINLSKFRYVVFATHGIMDAKVSGLMEPALVLGQFGNKNGDDGFLTMTEVMGLNLNCDIVALTACLTGRGRLVSGEGIMGLARAFQYAGSKSVLASLWSVNEKSSMILMDRFFYYLNNGADSAVSLRNARSDVRKSGYDHPYYWAPFVLIGEVQN